MAAPDTVLELVERFDSNIDAYRSGHYKETQVRVEFIDPFFEALGWDIHNKAGNAEAYKDVVHEAAVKVGGSTKAPDYSFRIGGHRKFFLEAKKPSVDIEGNPHPAFQLRRYAWSAKLPLSILTDFEEFAVYDCRARPVQSDKSSHARTLYLTYKDYADRWDELYGLFSKEAVLKGDFDRYVASTTKKRGTAEVDSAFLKEIEQWRDALARNIALRNKDITQRDLNFVVGRTIDRIIFLRICEDRGIENPDQLRALQNGPHAYKRLLALYHRADDRYNSGLFHFRAEKNRPTPHDVISLALHIDDKVLKDIVKSLYYPDSPYEFSVLPADILGQVYEQFLGKVIRLTAGHQAKVEDKPEVKKAGGIYYTPTYIVDYIVEHTVGKLLEGSTPRKAAKLRILDPACGSGSFLLGAYQYLLNWHRDWYLRDGKGKHKKELVQTGTDDWRLTTAERKRILLNNLYGVDIDAQAVEVTKLALLLKVLEGESAETINITLKMFHERALPDLGSNIKCGNSLIGPDFYENVQMNLLDEEERFRINVFDWQAEFPDILDRRDKQGQRRADKQQGFDAVIGNPPWISAWTGEKGIRTYLATKFESLSGHWDMYLAFLHRTIDLLNANGKHSFIYPTSLLTEPYAAGARKMLIEKDLIARLSDFGIERVFKKVSRKACILVLDKKRINDVVIIDSWKSGKIEKTSVINPALWAINLNYIYSLSSSERGADLKKKIDKLSIRVGNIYYVNYGAQISSKIKGEFTKDRLLHKLNTKNSKKCLIGANVKRYFIEWDNLYLDYQPAIMYGPRHPKFFESKKIIVNKTSSKGFNIIATYDAYGYYCDQRLICLVEYKHLADTPLRLSFKGYTKFDTEGLELYHTGVLNSKLLSYYFSNYIATKNLQGGYTDVLPKMVRSLPLRTIDFSDPTDKARHDRMVALVEDMLALNKQLAAAEGEHTQVALQRQIDATDKQIDRLVYELYELTEEEIGIVEGL